MTSSTGSPTLSVVIPSYHRLGHLPALVSAYRAQGADEVIVVLDGPHPGWHELIRPDEVVRIIEHPVNRGRSQARLTGLEAARGDVVLEVDDDVVPADGLVERHRRFHSGGPGRVLLGYMPVALPTRRSADQAPTFLYAHDYEVQASVWRKAGSAAILSSLWGGNLSVDRALYLRAESNRPLERLDYNEDLDLGLRLLDLGATAAFDQEARAEHHHERGLRSFIAECATRGEAIAILERRWGNCPPQLVPMVTIPPAYNRLLARLQRGIAARGSGGWEQALATGLYRLAGAVRLWRLQDGVTRLLRRGLILRAYSASRRERFAEIDA